METFTSEFVYHYDVALPENGILIGGAFIRSSILKRLENMQCNIDQIYAHGGYLYAFRPISKDYVRIGLY